MTDTALSATENNVINNVIMHCAGHDAMRDPGTAVLKVCAINTHTHMYGEVAIETDRRTDTLTLVCFCMVCCARSLSRRGCRWQRGSVSAVVFLEEPLNRPGPLSRPIPLARSLAPNSNSTGKGWLLASAAS